MYIIREKKIALQFTASDGSNKQIQIAAQNNLIAGYQRRKSIVKRARSIVSATERGKSISVEYMRFRSDSRQLQGDTVTMCFYNERNH